MKVSRSRSNMIISLFLVFRCINYFAKMMIAGYLSKISNMFSSHQVLHLIIMSCFCVSLWPHYCHSLLLEESAEDLLSSMNTSVDPCEDFYGFACGSYAQTSDSSDPIGEALDLMLTNISNFLEMNSSSSDPLILRKARTLYRSCLLNNPAHRDQNVESLANVLRQVGLSPTPPLNGVSENFSYVFTMARAKIISNMNFFVRPIMSRENSTHVSLFLVKPSGVDYFSSMLAEHHVFTSMTDNTTNTENYQYFLELARIYTRVMYNHTNKTVPDLASSKFNSTFKKLYLLDMFLDYAAETTMGSDCGDGRNLTVLEPNKFNWTEYFAILLEDTPGMLMNEEISLADGAYINFILDWVTRVMQPWERELYMWWKMVYKLAPYASIYESRESENSWCADQVNKILPHATALMLVNQSDTLQAMMKIGNMAEDIRNVFNSTITNATWMSQAHKDQMSKKLMDTKICIGYPLWLNDFEKVNKFHEKYNEVNLVEDDFFTNFLAFEQIRQRMENLIDWSENSTMPPCDTFESLDVNCEYYPFQNELQIHSGYLQFPFYGHIHTALNFGSMGSTIGHEFGHAFDRTRMGNLLNTFGDKDGTQKEYYRRVQCIIDHYSNYSKANNATGEYSANEKLLLRHRRYSNWTAKFKHCALADAQRTVNENLSDVNGLTIAFNTYKDHSKKYGSEPSPYGLEKYTQDQLFFIGYASKFCSQDSRSSYSDWTDVHSPQSIRVWEPLRNSEDFVKAWGCERGSRMNPNAEKCELW